VVSLQHSRTQRAMKCKLLKLAMRSNNAFERTVGHRGPRLAAAQATWPAAQLGRWVRSYEPSG
jgi:hypothetical protein